MNKQKSFLVWLAAVLMTACGGGGGSAPSGPPVATTPPAPVVQTTRTSIALTSDAGDPIGQGKAYSYTLANAEVTVTALGNHLSVTVGGDEQWTADFQTGGNDTELKAGTYSDLDAYVPGAGTGNGGLRWYGEGRGCTTSKGWFAIDRVTYAGSALKSISLRFERHCDGAAAALRGVVEFSADDKAVPAQPVAAPPSDLWRPPAGFGTGSGNEVYLESSAGDYVGLGKTYRYDGSNSDLWAASGYQIYLEVHGDEEWRGTFKAMTSLPRVEAGYYPDLRVTPFNNPVKGGMTWAGEGRGCSTLQGWFVVDTITYVNGTMTELDLRFEQHCEGRAAPLRGAVHWRANAPANPVTIAPSVAGSWHPPPVAAAGNYLYLEGDPSGSPRFRSRHLLSSADAVFSASLDAGYLHFEVNGQQRWFGDFQLNRPGGQLQAGLYDRLVRYMYPGMPEDSISWTAESRACAAPRGWLAIDSISYAGGKLSAIDLRFEQVCDGAPEPLHGVLHWRAGETVMPPGPATTAPPEFWQPPSQVVPPSGNYLYLAPDRDDHIAGGANYRYTPADAVISVSENGGHLVLGVDGDEHWTADFQAMSSLERLQPGYYAGLAGFYVRNPATGGFSFSGEARACNVSRSGVVIDSVSYENGRLSAIALRFEQHCEIGRGALRGALRWSAGDRTAAPGPVTVPASLWRPPAGATPASGSYVFLQSESGDFIGEGKTWLHTPQTAPLAVSASGGKLSVSTGDLIKGWQGEFIVMNSLTQLQPGFYDRLLQIPIFNPAHGGFRWSGMGHGCNTGISWVAIDSVTYAGGKLASLHARFEQHCDYKAPALRGEIHWEG